MIRYIKLNNDKKRDAEITFRSLNPKPSVTMVMENGDKVINKRVVKGTSQTSTQTLLSNYNEKPKEGIDFQMQLAGRLVEDLIAKKPKRFFLLRLNLKRSASPSIMKVIYLEKALLTGRVSSCLSRRFIISWYFIKNTN